MDTRNGISGNLRGHKHSLITNPKLAIPNPIGRQSGPQPRSAKEREHKESTPTLKSGSMFSFYSQDMARWRKRLENAKAASSSRRKDIELGPSANSVHSVCDIDTKGDTAPVC